MSRHIVFEDQDIFYHHLQDLFDSKSRQVCELHMAKKDGTLFDARLESTVNFDDHKDPEQFLTAVLDITGRKRAEQDQEKMTIILEDKVKERTAELEDMNATLKVLLKKREEDREDIEEKIFANHKFILSPIIASLKKTLSQEKNQDKMNILESELKNIMSPFSKKLSDQMINLTPTEIHVADLIKLGKTNKEISAILHSSVHTISRHRENIRKKTGIKNKKINLRAFLLTLQ